MAFLSATRGWILSFGFMAFLHFILFQKMNAKILKVLSIFSFAIVGALIISDSFRTQVQFTFERLLTLESLASGDLTADGTLIRLDERGPQVMSVWEENPVFGAGFSDVFLEAQDFHVGNQNILMHAGVVGYILFAGFLGFFVFTLLRRYRNTTHRDPYKMALPTFVILLCGWFFLHSSSQQLFAYYGMPVNIIPQAIFFSLAGFTYVQSISFRLPDPADES